MAQVALRDAGRGAGVHRPADGFRIACRRGGAHRPGVLVLVV